MGVRGEPDPAERVNWKTGDPATRPDIPPLPPPGEAGPEAWLQLQRLGLYGLAQAGHNSNLSLSYSHLGSQPGCTFS